MSLKVWLPLNGDIHNQGLLDVGTSVYGSISYEDGKIGKAARITTGTAMETNGVTIESNLVSELGDEYSCAVWVKPTGNHINYEGCIIGSGDWNRIAWSFGLNQTNTKVSVFQRGYNNYIDCEVPVNTWTHLTSTVKDGVAKLYKNGEYVGTKNVALELGSDANVTRIGQASYTTYFSFNGCIQDVRIYNHCLSSKEIKEISKALVIHLPLNREGFGCDNLIFDSNTVTSCSCGSGITRSYMDDGSVKITSTSPNGNYATVFFARSSNDYVGANMSVGDTYTISCDVKVEEGTKLPTLFINSGNQYKRLQGNIVLGKWIRAYYTSTWGEPGTQYGNIALHLGFSDAIGTYYFKNFKLEKTDKPTPWIPNSTDALYSAMGLDSGIVYDTSGFANNCTALATLGHSSDTPKYNVSTFFDGTDNQAIQVPFNSVINTDIPFTINLWFKKTELGTRAYETLFGGPSGFEMDTRAGGATTLSLYMASTRSGNLYSPFNFDEWYMVTMASDRTNEYYYVNGDLVNTIAAKSMPTGTYYIGAWQTAIKQNYKGYISDFRIYATCLSATDIKELYNTAASLANNGTLFANELTEV